MKREAYIPNSADIIYQLIDGEYIFLNQTNGNYFSLDHLGVMAWDFVLRSIPVEILFKMVEEAAPGRAATFIPRLKTVFSDLVEEGLALSADANQEVSPRFLQEISEKLQSDEDLWIEPKLHSYKNIQEKYAHPCGVKEI